MVHISSKTMIKLIPLLCREILPKIRVVMDFEFVKDSREVLTRMRFLDDDGVDLELNDDGSNEKHLRALLAHTILEAHYANAQEDLAPRCTLLAVATAAIARRVLSEDKLNELLAKAEKEASEEDADANA